MSKSSVMMAFFWQGALLLSLAATALALAGSIRGSLSSLTQTVCERKLELFVLRPIQAWNWTVGLIPWRWCGQRADPRSIPRSFVWGTVSPPASRPGRLFSLWMSAIVTSGEWWAAYFYLHAVSQLYFLQLGDTCLSNRLLGISWCTPTTWPTFPSRTLKFSPSLTQLSVCMRGGCSYLQQQVFSKSQLCSNYFILCRPKDWYPLIYDPVFDTYGQGDLVFYIGLMNGGCETWPHWKCHGFSRHHQ